MSFLFVLGLIVAFVFGFVGGVIDELLKQRRKGEKMQTIEQKLAEAEDVIARAKAEEERVYVVMQGRAPSWRESSALWRVLAGYTPREQERAEAARPEAG